MEQEAGEKILRRRLPKFIPTIRDHPLTKVVKYGKIMLFLFL